MVEIKFLEDKSSLPLTDEQRDFFAFSATDNGRTVGYCLFTLGAGAVTLRFLKTDPEDFGVADGLARAVLNGCRGIVEKAEFEPGCRELDEFARSTGAFGAGRADIDGILSGCAGS